MAITFLLAFKEIDWGTERYARGGKRRFSNPSTNKGPSRSDKLRFFRDLAQKLGKNVEKTNIIVA